MKTPSSRSELVSRHAKLSLPNRRREGEHLEGKAHDSDFNILLASLP
jgi:hypothetical protein